MPIVNQTPRLTKVNISAVLFITLRACETLKQLRLVAIRVLASDVSIFMSLLFSHRARNAVGENAVVASL